MSDVAERARFELAKACTLAVFKTADAVRALFGSFVGVVSSRL